MLLLKHTLKLKRHTAMQPDGSDGYFRDDVPCYRGLDCGQMRGGLSEVRGSTPPLGGLYNILRVCMPSFGELT